MTVLNLGQGGWKQPQQLLALNYFLSLGQRFDVIVNLDGFNEIALGYHNHLSGIDYSLPSAHVLLPLVRLADVSTQYDEYLVPMVNAMKSHRLLMECDLKKNLANYTIIHQLYSACSKWAYRVPE